MATDTEKKTFIYHLKANYFTNSAGSLHRKYLFNYTLYKHRVIKENYLVFMTEASTSPRGVGDKPVFYKPGVAGSIPGFSIKQLSVSLPVLPS